MSSRTLRLAHRRGQATVEMAVLCILLVPMILYELFLDDLLRFKLNQAEAVYSAAWDYTVADYENNTTGETERQIRRSYCDHTYANNSYSDVGYDCNDDAHHKSVMAHECWVSNGAKQVTCIRTGDDIKNDPGGKRNYGTSDGLTSNESGEAKFSAFMTQGVIDKVHKGGQRLCSARLGVVNYFLPQKILQEFSKEKTTESTMFHEEGGTVHSVAKSKTTTSNHVLLRQEGFSVLTDTWAMTTIEDSDPDAKSGVLWDRVDAAYPSLMAIGAQAYGAELVLKQLLAPQAIFDSLISGIGSGDSPMTPHTGFSKDATYQKNGHSSTAWTPGKSQQVYNKRGGHYLGATSLP